MQRFDLIQALVKIADQNTAIVCNIGDPCKELYAIADRELNFYMLGSLGLASSIGFGIAVSTPETDGSKTVVIDGDGGILMNMGTLATIGRYMPKGLVIVIADNGCYGSTGNQPTATSTNCNLTDAARACGIRQVDFADNLDSFKGTFESSLKKSGPSVIVARVTAENSISEIVPLTGSQIRDRFMSALKRDHLRHRPGRENRLTGF
jgi:sulfopyruvate decarboxylase subunit beta